MYLYQRIHPLITFLLGCFLFCTLSAATAQAASLSIKYDGKKYEYKGTQAKVTLDNKSISLDETPGLILDNTCLVSAKNVFADTLNADYSYDNTTNGVLISKNNRTIAMTLGSKTAYVDGVKKTLDTAPRKITFMSQAVTKVYVPARFVAENLGYTYKWNSKKKTAAMKSPIEICYDDNESWQPYLGTKGNVVIGGKTIQQNDIPGIFIDETLLLRANLIFKTNLGCYYQYNGGNKEIQIAKGGVFISMTLDSKTAYVNGTEIPMPAAPRQVYSKATSKSYVMVPGEFVAEQLKYEYIWNASTDSALILDSPTTVYFTEKWDSSLANGANIITEIQAQKEEETEVITITAAADYSQVVSESTDGTSITIHIDNIYNDFAAIEQSIYNGIYLKKVTTAPEGNGVSVILEKTAEGSYHTVKTGNTLKIVLSKPETPPDDDTSDDDDENDNDDSNDDIAYMVKIGIPEGVRYSSIKDTDKYDSKQIILTIPGDYTDFFDSNPITYNKSRIKKVAVSLSGSSTKITITTSKLQAYRLHNCENYIGIEVDDPKEIYDQIVALDAGHGGNDPGAINSSKAKEKDLTLKIIYNTAKKYFDAADSEIKAYWTRSSDVFITLTDRAAFAKKLGADLFVSLHMNSASSSAKGLEVLYASNNKNKMGSMNSKTMAGIYKDNLVSELGMTNRGIKDRTRLVVLYRNTVPSILIELGFISNSSDYGKIKTASFQDKTAKTIYNSTVEVFDEYSTGR